MSAEECFANAANDFVVAVEVEPSAVSAKGNLGNALLARGVALRALRDATAERVFGSSSKKGAFGGLSEEDVRFYGETAEDALVDAGKYFRAVASVVWFWSRAVLHRRRLIEPPKHFGSFNPLIEFLTRDQRVGLLPKADFLCVTVVPAISNNTVLSRR